MKQYRFNTKVGTSRGLGVFRNRGSDYLELAPKYRDMYQRKRTDMIASTIDYYTTIADSSSYMPTAKIWQEIDKLASSRWDKDFWMHEDIETWTQRALGKAGKVYEYINNEYGVDFFNNNYIPVYYDNVTLGIQKDFGAFANFLVQDGAGKRSVELYNFAFRILENGRKVLYARINWLRTFKSGCDIINYYRIAKSRKFKKVYRF